MCQFNAVEISWKKWTKNWLVCCIWLIMKAWKNYFYAIVYAISEESINKKRKIHWSDKVVCLFVCMCLEKEMTKKKKKIIIYYCYLFMIICSVCSWFYFSSGLCAMFFSELSTASNVSGGVQTLFQNLKEQKKQHANQMRTNKIYKENDHYAVKMKIY